VNNREKNFTHERLQRRMAAIDEGIARYLAELDRADRQAAATGAPAPASTVAKLTGRIDKLKARMKNLAALEAKLVASGENQISLTDPDARAMTSTSHSAYTVGYNVQSAVDTKHHLIVTHEVTNIGIDKDQLSLMAEQARDALDADTIEVLPDKGYFNSEEIAACDAGGIEVYVPKPATSNSRAQARLDNFPGAMHQRRETAEHPFGTIKAWMGATHFKMKTLAHVSTEMALHVLAYNIKRVIAILGVPKLIEAITAFLSFLAITIGFDRGFWTAQRPSRTGCT